MIELRRAAEDDLDWLEGLGRSCFSPPWTRESFAHALSGAGSLVLVALCGGERAGYLVLSHVLDEGSVDSVCTGPEFRRRGAGSALLRAAIEEGRRLSLARITLEVRKSNTAAIALYEKYGFLSLGIRPGYYERPREDAVIMTLELGDAENDNTLC